MRCSVCGAPLSGDAVGLHKKLLDRGATSFLCIPCLSARLGCPTEVLEASAARFRAEGCALFPPEVPPAPFHLPEV